MNILFIDTETSDLFKNNLDINNPLQGRVLQISWELCTENNDEISSYNSYLLPIGSEYYDKENGWKISPGAFNVHHITLETCHKIGLPKEQVFAIASCVIHKSDLICGHNISFDILMIIGELTRLGAPQRVIDKIKSIPLFCTMGKSRNIVKAVDIIGRIKNPTLTETYEYYINKKFEDAHNSKYDVKACREIYFTAKKRNLL